MATYNSLSALFSAIADAIRAKRGTSAAIAAQNFPSQIAAIQSANYATANATLSAQTMTLSFTDLKGSPKFFLAIVNQSSFVSTSSSNYHKILAVYKTDTGSTKYALSMYVSGSSARASRSTNLSYEYDSGTSTLTIESASTSSPGYFLGDATYTLIYTY